MKKIVMITGIILTVIIVIIVSLHCYSILKVGTFSLDTYAEEIETFSRSDVVGKIESSKDAVLIARKLWIEIYGESVNRNVPYRVYYDDMNQTWLVTGSFFVICPSGPYAIIKSDGNVLAIWNEKN